MRAHPDIHDPLISSWPGGFEVLPPQRRPPARGDSIPVVQRRVPGPKRRRFYVKAKHTNALCRVPMTYHDGEIPGRRFADHLGAQPLPRRILQKLLPYVVGLDLQNAVFTIHLALVQMLQIHNAEVFVVELKVLEEVRFRREGLAVRCRRHEVTSVPCRA